MNFQEQLDALEAGIARLLTGAFPNGETRSTTPNAILRPSPGEAAPDISAQDGGPLTLYLTPLPEKNELALTLKNQTIAFNPSQLEQLIEKLLEMRALMQPETTRESPPGQNFTAP